MWMQCPFPALHCNAQYLPLMTSFDSQEDSFARGIDIIIIIIIIYFGQ